MLLDPTYSGKQLPSWVYYSYVPGLTSSRIAADEGRWSFGLFAYQSMSHLRVGVMELTRQAWTRLMGSRRGGSGWLPLWGRCLIMDAVNFLNVVSDTANRSADAINTTVSGRVRQLGLRVLGLRRSADASLSSKSSSAPTPWV
jgi:hypothetical protein